MLAREPATEEKKLNELDAEDQIFVQTAVRLTPSSTGWPLACRNHQPLLVSDEDGQCSTSQLSRGTFVPFLS